MGRRRMRVWTVAVAGAALAVAGCGDDDEGAADTTTTTAASTSGGGDFCDVQPRFAEELNTALANADPDAAQYTQIGPILDDLAPIIEELRAAEPPELDGTVDEWVTGMEGFATGEEPVAPAEDARGRMDAWVADNC